MFQRLSAVVVFFLSAALLANSLPDPGDCSHKIILSEEAGLAPIRLTRSTLTPLLHYQSQRELQHYREVQAYYVDYRETYRRALQRRLDSQEPAEIAEEVAQQTAESALDKQLSAKANQLGESADEYVRTYFGKHFGINRTITGDQLEELHQTVLAQVYLAQFNLKFAQSLLQQLPPGAELVEVTPEAISNAFGVAAQSLVNPSFEFHFLKKLTRLADIRTIQTEVDDDGRTSVFARAKRQELEIALAKAQAFSLDEALPTAIQTYLAEYLLLVRGVPQLQAHPILVDITRHAEPLSSFSLN